MSTLPSNSTFLPVLDDLLSPDFRTVSLPGQTPQTPAETPVSGTGKTVGFVESHMGQLTTKTSNYPGVKKGERPTSATSSSSRCNGVESAGVKSRPGPCRHNHTPQSAAMKIQRWWKGRKGKKHVSADGHVIDVKAERVKHTIRHSRTEEHVRFLETEVQRLKSALATERKLRSLQVEAIRSMWSQVQKVSSISASPSTGDNSIMSQSMPNGLPYGSGVKTDLNQGFMSMSLQGSIEPQPQLQQQQHSHSHSDVPCTCTTEIQTMKDSFSSEMKQLRNMIEQLKMEGPSGGGGDEAKGSPQVQRRPATLDLSGGGSRCSSAAEKEDNPTEDKKEISGFADQMASSIIEGAKDEGKE